MSTATLSAGKDGRRRGVPHGRCRFSTGGPGGSSRGPWRGFRVEVRRDPARTSFWRKTRGIRLKFAKIFPSCSRRASRLGPSGAHLSSARASPGLRGDAGGRAVGGACSAFGTHPSSEAVEPSCVLMAASSSERRSVDRLPFAGKYRVAPGNRDRRRKCSESRAGPVQPVAWGDDICHRSDRPRGSQLRRRG